MAQDITYCAVDTSASRVVAGPTPVQTPLAEGEEWWIVETIAPTVPNGSRLVDEWDLEVSAEHRRVFATRKLAVKTQGDIDAEALAAARAELVALDVVLPRIAEDVFSALQIDTTKLPAIVQQRLAAKAAARAEVRRLNAAPA